MTSTSKRATPIDVEVGHRIRVARKAAKMSQESPAEALGVTFKQVQKYENGKNRVGAGRLFAIPKALNVEVVDFFEERGIKKKQNRVTICRPATGAALCAQARTGFLGIAQCEGSACRGPHVRWLCRDRDPSGGSAQTGPSSPKTKGKQRP